VVALPGGIGTLDELIETFALIHLKQYHGKILVLDHKGFYQPLKALLAHYKNCGMLSSETFSKLKFAQTGEELLDLLED
jgi:predicted Rossmann-fold nucleotide-binding protein